MTVEIVSITGVMPAPILLNRLYPESHRQVFPFRNSEQRAQFLLVTILKLIEIERNSPS